MQVKAAAKLEEAIRATIATCREETEVAVKQAHDAAASEIQRFKDLYVKESQVRRALHNELVDLKYVSAFPLRSGCTCHAQHDCCVLRASQGQHPSVLPCEADLGR